jgi:hypothetical protein
VYCMYICVWEGYIHSIEGEGSRCYCTVQMFTVQVLLWGYEYTYSEVHLPLHVLFGGGRAVRHEVQIGEHLCVHAYVIRGVCMCVRVCVGG